MLYLPKYDCTFFIPQKVASASVKDSIMRSCGIPYISWETWEAKNIIDKEKGRIVLFVRNPFDRIVSCYLNQVQKGKGRFEEFGITKDSSFYSFVEFIVNTEPYKADKHFKPYYTWFPDRHDFIVRFETINEDWNNLNYCLKINLEDLDYKNKTLERNHWSSYYDKRLLNKVYKYYKKDFERFDY